MGVNSVGKHRTWAFALERKEDEVELDLDDSDDDSDSEEAIFTEEERNNGKDEKLIPRIVAGRMNKYFKENCLLEQQFILSEDKKDTIRKVLNDCAKENGFDSIDIVSYLKWECSSSQD